MEELEEHGPNTLDQMLQKLTSSLENEFNGYATQFREIRSYLYPESGDALVNDDSNDPSKALYNNILDLVVTEVVDTLAAGMLSGMISPVKDWLALELDTPNAELDTLSRQWLDVVTEIILWYFKENGFYQSGMMQLRDLGVYGTSVMLIEEVEDRIQFDFIPMGEFYLDQDAYCKIDTFARKVQMTAREIVQRYGMSDDLPEVIRKGYYDQDHEERFAVWHIIMPRPEALQALDQESGKPIRSEEMPWASYHYLDMSNGRKDQNRNIILYEGGYMEKPFAAPRWQRVGRRVYGVGCGRKALVACKRLREEVYQYMLNLELNNNPPLGYPGDTPNQLVVTPGMTNPVPANSGEVKPLFEARLDENSLRADIEDIRRQVENAFHYKTFVLLRDIDKQMTIPELRQLQQEQMTMLAPYMTQISREMLEVVVDRVFGILMRAGAFPEPPEQIRGQKIKISFIGELAKRQKSAEIIPIDQTLEFALKFVGLAPNIMDNFNLDEVMHRVADANDFDTTMMNTDEQKQQIREGRAQEQQQQQQLQMMKEGAGMMKDLGSANMNEETVLGAVDKALSQSGPVQGAANE